MGERLVWRRSELSLERGVRSELRTETHGTPTFKELARKRKPGSLKSSQEVGSKDVNGSGMEKGQKEQLNTQLNLLDVQTFASVPIPINCTFITLNNFSIPKLISGATSKINP